jgi:hypothetical protein
MGAVGPSGIGLPGINRSLDGTEVRALVFGRDGRTTYGGFRTGQRRQK